MMQKQVFLKVFLPILSIALFAIGIYSLLYYFLIVKYQLFEPKTILILFIFPVLIIGLITYLFVRSRINFLNFTNDKRKEGFYYIYFLTFTVSFILLQHYIDVKGGKLTQVDNPNEINIETKTRFYKIKKFELIKEPFICMWVSRQVTGRYGTDLQVKVSFICPMGEMFDDENALPPFNHKIWFGKKYTETFNYKKSKTAGGIKEIDGYISACTRIFLRDNFGQSHYFSRVLNSDEKDDYMLALERLPFSNGLSKEIIILKEEEGVYASRGKNTLRWTIGVFISGVLLLYLFLYNKKIKKDKLISFRNLTPNERIKNSMGLLMYLVPNQKIAVTPILIDLNLLMFIIMVSGGVSFFNPSMPDLVRWGALLKPAVLGGEWWRIFTSMFMHSGIIHLLYNMIALGFIGLFMEVELSKVEYLSFYLITGIVAALVSLGFNDNSVAVGASGAIMGMYGVGISMILAKDKNKNKKREIKNFMILGILAIIIPTLLMGFVTNADNAAHIGGLFCGFILSSIYFYIKPFILNLLEEL